MAVDYLAAFRAHTTPRANSAISAISFTDRPNGTNGTNGTGVETPKTGFGVTKMHHRSPAMATTTQPVEPVKSAPKEPAVPPKVSVPQTSEEWRAWFAGRIQHRRALGYDEDQARRLAWGEAECEWHLQHANPDPHRCAGCGNLVTADAMKLPDGARVHGVECLCAYGDQWRGEAAAALHEMALTESAA